MWKELQKYPPFFISLVQVQKYIIHVTDFVQIWIVSYSRDEFINLLKECNHQLEIDSKELLEKGLQMLQKPMELKNINISIKDEVLTVTLVKYFGYSLKLVVNLKEGSKEMFFSEITQPSLKVIHDLRTSESELRELLAIKDDEIKEYKSFGGKIRYTAIPPYDNEVHMKKHRMYSDSFGDAEISDNILKRAINIPETNIPIKEEPVNIMPNAVIKQEPEKQEGSGPSVSLNSLISNIKKENIKNEYQPKRKRKLNL